MTTTTTTNPEFQAKIGEALQTFYDAQLALQRDAFEATRLGVQSMVALQRAGVRGLVRAVESTVEPVAMNDEVLVQSLRAWTATLPNVTPEVAEKLANDAAASVKSVQSTVAKAGVQLREAAAKQAAQYEQALGAVESRAVDGLKAAEQSVNQGTILAGRVTGEWVDAFFEAMKSAQQAAEEAQTAVVADGKPASDKKA